MNQQSVKRRTLAKAAALFTGAAIMQANGAQAAPRARQSPAARGRDGVSLFVRDRGAGTTFAFAAPWALTADWWEYQIAALTSAGARCITYDRRGHGRSQETDQGYDMDTLADDLAAVIEQHNVRDCVLVGHSMGAGEVVRYLARHGPGRVRQLVLIAPIAPFTLKTDNNPAGVPAEVLETGRRDLARDRPGQIAAAAPAFFGAARNNTSAAMQQWWINMILEGCSLKVMLDLHRRFTETDFRPDLRGISAPTTIFHGDADASAPLDFAGRPTAALIPQSRLVVYESAAHALPVTHAARLNADLLQIAGS